MSERHAHALELMLQRIEQTAAEPPSVGFPHYADSNTGVWTRSRAGDWTGGFWIGELWLAGRITGDERYIEFGREWARALLPRARSNTIFRGFLFWYGAALGNVLHDDETAGEIALTGARALGKDFNQPAQLIPLGADAEEASDIGPGEANIDGVPGGTPLLIWAARRAGETLLEEKARAHARSHVGLCVRDNKSVCQSASFDPNSGAILRRYTHKGAHDNSTWTRAQAWAMLGFTQAVCAGVTELLDVAVAVSDWWCDHLPADLIASWDFDDPHGPRDTSGTAIAAASLLKLSTVADARSHGYTELAAAIVDALIDGHLTGIDASDPSTPGILTNGCYNNRIGLATSHELIWGDYFLLEALCSLNGCISSQQL